MASRKGPFDPILHGVRCSMCDLRHSPKPSRSLLAAGVMLISWGAASLAFAAEDPARQAVLDSYAVEAKAVDPSFSGFSAARGEALYRTTHPQAKTAEIAQCLSCHGADPHQAGRNARTGKVIDPMAVSITARRFTSRDETEKWFGRNCPEVVGRVCSALEKGDFITFLAKQ